MPSRTLSRIRDKVRKRLYIVTLHADEEMDEDGLTIFDVESVILTGEIVEQQRDRKTGERKYIVRGEVVDGRQTACVICKFGPTDKLVILTVYAD